MRRRRRPEGRHGRPAPRDTIRAACYTAYHPPQQPARRGRAPGTPTSRDSWLAAPGCLRARRRRLPGCCGPGCCADRATTT
eukprot:1614749-Prymnesium_polylepis.1